eukprot:2127303-Amphidinium_carterae.1
MLPSEMSFMLPSVVREDQAVLADATTRLHTRPQPYEKRWVYGCEAVQQFTASLSAEAHAPQAVPHYRRSRPAA